MPAVILVRHAQASFGGQSYDVLSDVGHAQAQATAAALHERGLRVGKVVSGSLRRQLDTARPIAALVGTDVEIDERWNEYGADELLTHYSTTAAREERRPGDDTPAISSRDFQVLLDDALMAWIAAGESGRGREPFPAFVARVRAALGDAAAGVPSGATAVVATSGGVIGALCMALLNVAPRAMIDFNRVTVNAALTKVIVGRGGMTLVSFNEHGHLEGTADPLVTYR